MRSRLVIVFIVVVFATGLGAALWLWIPHDPQQISRRPVRIGEREITMLVVPLPRSLRHYTLVVDPEHPKTVHEWREELGAEIVFNGSYFNEDGTPSGYWKLGKGKSVVSWPTLEEQADPHGYTFALSLLVDGLHMRYLPADPMEEPVDEMFLSFPTLVAGGEPMVERDSGQLARRTSVAEDADGEDYLILTEEGTLSLYEFAQWLSEQPERFVIAGNLDGGPSTGVSIENNKQDIEVLSADVPNVIAIFRNSTSP